MGTTAQKLQAIQNSKAAIKSAIEAKGVSDVGDVLSTYATKIADIPTGGGSKYGLTMDNILGDVNAQGALQPPAVGSLSSSAIVSIPDYGLYQKFYNGKISSVSLPNLTTIGSYGMNQAFYGNTSLTSVYLPNLTTINAQNAMNSAFYGCTSLTSVDLSNLTTIGTNALGSTFYGCTSLTSVDLSNLTTIGTVGLTSTFRDCTNLKTVYLTKVSNSTGSQGVTFMGCTSLELVDFSEATVIMGISTNTFQNTNNTFKVVVPDALYNSWIAATNWSSIASHIVKASEYTPAS